MCVRTPCKVRVRLRCANLLRGWAKVKDHPQRHGQWQLADKELRARAPRRRLPEEPRRAIQSGAIKPCRSRSCSGQSPPPMRNPCAVSRAHVALPALRLISGEPHPASPRAAATARWLVPPRSTSPTAAPAPVNGAHSPQRVARRTPSDCGAEHTGHGQVRSPELVEPQLDGHLWASHKVASEAVMVSPVGIAVHRR